MSVQVTPFEIAMTTGHQEASSRKSESLRRFVRRTQLSRAAVFTLAYPLTLILIPIGILKISPIHATIALLFAAGSAYVFYLAARIVDVKYLGARINFISLVVDGMTITALVYLDGGLSSPFFIWYVANTAAATFSFGMRATHQMIAINTALYLFALALRGEVGLFDPPFFRAIGQLAFLYGSAYFAFRGIAVARDRHNVVQQLRAEEKLKVEALTRLTQELDEQSTQLAEANVEIRHVNRLKSQFLANMSHELRTPLNSVIGFANILQDSLRDRATDKEMRFLTNILNSGEHLLALINDLLDLSKIEAGKMEVNPEIIDVESLLTGIREVMRGASTPRNIEIELDLSSDLSNVVADLSKVKQIVFNLLSNAVKFSRDHSVVSVIARIVSADESPSGTESLRIDIVDHGIGIAQIDIDVIFDEFRQADDGFVRQYGGTGLGLTLVKRFLEIQGGSIEVDSTLGVGSTFRVWLPSQVSPVTTRRPSRMSVRPPKERSHVSPTRQKILVVEDDPVAWANLSAILESAGYATVRASRGEEVFSIIEAEHPDLITLDLVLPGLDGWKVLKNLKSREQTRNIPLVIVSVVESRELGLTLGADDYFIKPVAPESFVKRITELSSQRLGGTDNPSVLLIDDDPDLHELVANTLGPHGYSVISAATGEEGLSLAEESPPSLIVIDLLMDGLSGFEVVSRLRKNSSTANIPVIVLSDEEITAETRGRLTDAIEGLFQKSPESRREFLDRIAEIARRSEMSSSV